MTIQDISVSRKWWWHRRCKYNKGLIIAGFIAFLLYNIPGPIIIAPHEEFEETIFEIVLQSGAYFIMMCAANVFYTSGWLVDISFNKSGNEQFRERLFAVGYWFSFSLPILVIPGVMARFLIK